jgi:hypothetical protein
MPRRQANVNQADVQRIIRACQREKVPFRVTLQPSGAAVFEPVDAAVPLIDDLDRELADFEAEHVQG